MVAYVKVNNSWKSFDPTVKVDGSWKSVSNGFIKVDGYWKEFYKIQNSIIFLQSGYTYSTDLGLSVVDNGPNGTGNFSPAVYMSCEASSDENLFVALPYYSDQTSNIGLYSTDGINWSSTTLPVTGYWGNIEYGNGKFVAVSFLGQTLYSTDGINWSSGQIPPPPGNDTTIINSMKYGNGIFMAVSSNRMYTSTDGINWSYSPTSAGSSSSLFYANGKFFATNSSSGFEGNQVAITSDNGASWSIYYLPSAKRWVSFGFINNVFVFAAKKNSSSSTIKSYAYSSNNGQTWTESDLPQSLQQSVSANSMISTEDKLILFGATNGPLISEDGINWTQIIASNIPTFISSDVVYKKLD